MENEKTSEMQLDQIKSRWKKEKKKTKQKGGGGEEFFQDGWTTHSTIFSQDTNAPEMNEEDTK